MATHSLGGNIYAECMGNCTQRIYVSYYVECAASVTNTNPPAAPTSPNFAITGIGGSCNAPTPIGNWQLGTFIEVTPLCAGVQSTCDDPVASIYGQTEAVYYRDYDFCSSNCSDYEVKWEVCCRSAAHTSGSAQSNIYITSTINVDSALCNSTPIFDHPPTMLMCSGQPIALDMSATDADGDSLVYTLVDCLEGDNDPVNYLTNYSGTSPMGATWTVSLDAETGMLDIQPTGGGVPVAGAICIEISEYRNGQLLSQTVRDMQIQTQNCANNVPSLGGLQNVQSGVTVASNRIVTCTGATLTFEIPISDADNDSLIISSNISAQLPGATWSTSGMNPTLLYVSWPIDTSHQGLHTFSVFVRDDVCPMYGQQNITYEILVQEFSVDITTGGQCGTLNTQLIANVTGGQSPYSYVWSNGATTPSIFVTWPGIYIVWVTDVLGCMTIDTFDTSIVIDGILTATQPSCGTADGMLEITMSNGVPPYTYLWNTGDTTSTLSNINTGGYSVTVTDALGCTFHTATVLEDQDSCFYSISGTAFYDANGNCIQDVGETPLPFAWVDVEPGGGVWTDSVGNFYVPVDTGVYSLSGFYNGSGAVTLCPSDSLHTITANTLGGDTTGIDFALQIPSNQDLRLEYVGSFARPGGSQNHIFTLYNDGGVPVSGTFRWTHDTIWNYSTATPALNSYDATTQTGEWNYTLLLPGSSRLFVASGYIDTTANMGDLWTMTAEAAPVVNDIAPANNYVNYIDTIRAAYDPNDKLVTPEGIGENGLIDPQEEALHYTVRFQNTGNDTAFYVVIRDPIDEDLDIHSFVPAGASHTYSVEAEGDSTLIFTFSNILLPDSTTDFAGSQGFVSFYLKLKPNLPLGTTIENQVGIYFDFNEPVITNTTLNTLYAFPILDPIPDAVICPMTEIDLVATVAGGTSPYTFEWNTAQVDVGTMSVLRTNVPGIYTVQVTDQFGFMDSLVITVDTFPLPNADFMIGGTGVSYSFIPVDTTGHTYLWNYGDGTSSQGMLGHHEYTQAGAFSVTLIVLNDCGSDTVTYEIMVTSLEDDYFEQSVEVYPNPTEGKLTVRFSNPSAQSYTLRIWDELGRLVQEIDGIRTEKVSIELRNTPSGLYLLELRGEQHTYNQRLQVK